MMFSVEKQPPKIRFITKEKNRCFNTCENNVEETSSVVRAVMIRTSKISNLKNKVEKPMTSIVNDGI